MSEVNHCPIVCACIYGDLAGLQKIIETCVSVSEIDCTLAFTTACLNGREDIVAFLLSQGWCPNVKNGAGFSPLISAADQGHHNIVTSLLEAGADITHRCMLGHTALWWATMGNHYTTMQTLQEWNSTVPAVEEAVHHEPQDGAGAAATTALQSVGIATASQGAESNYSSSDSSSDDEEVE
jgi:ankyrin repeat protein